MSHTAKVLLISVALATCAAPALADPLRITVPGGSRLPDPYLTPHYIFGDDRDPATRDILWDEYWTPSRLGGPFDGAKAAADAERIAHPKARGRIPFNPTLAATLSRTGESFSTHWLKCQTQYGSYDLVTDTYVGAGGIPRPCRM